MKKKGRPRQDLTGQRFGQLKVIKFHKMDNHRHSAWLCRCDCGTETVVLTTNLRKKNIKSCGCFKRIHGQASTPEYNRDYNLQRNYGISAEQYDIMYELQQGCCKICGTHQSYLKRALAVDHNHITGKVRGLLCGSCNLGIGLLQDDIELLSAALTYMIENN